MKQLFAKTPLTAWKKLISKLKYFKRECRKKDLIIKALEEQINILRG